MRFAGLRTVAFDGCNSVKIPGTDRNQSWIGKIGYRMGGILTARSIIIKAAKPIALRVDVPDLAMAGENVLVHGHTE